MYIYWQDGFGRPHCTASISIFAHSDVLYAVTTYPWKSDGFVILKIFLVNDVWHGEPV